MKSQKRALLSTLALFSLMVASSIGAQNTVQLAPNDLAAVRAMPNPWRSDRHSGSSITFDNLLAGATIKIFTISGHAVRTLTASGSSVAWDRTNESGERVASGVYLYVTSYQGQSKSGKLAIIK